MSINQYFRAGTGAIIYNEAGEILLFSRSDQPNIWQLQQGGQDAGESIEQTLWRELQEETGLIADNFSQQDTFPDWTLYAYDKNIGEGRKDSNCLGQAHRWFFLKLKPEVEIDLKTAQDKEFIDFKWGTFDELLEITGTLKVDVYTKLAEYFTSKVLTTNNY